MLSPQKLHQAFVFLARLPTDAMGSATSLYEALHYMSSYIAPDVTWKFEVLLTGLLLPNIAARIYHTHAVNLILNNFRRLVLHERYPSSVSDLNENDHLTSFSQRNNPFMPSDHIQR